jgi:ketosteroid isomerase-like protein
VSRENVQIVRTLYELGGDPFNAAAGQVDQVFRDHLDEQFEVRLPSDYPEGEPVFRGRAGVEEMFAMLADTWGKWRFEPGRFVDAGDRVVVFVRILAEGGASGVPIERETTHVWTIRGGRAMSMHAYRNRSQALEAVGLPR